jgi:hypothetical protein
LVLETVRDCCLQTEAEPGKRIRIRADDDLVFGRTVAAEMTAGRVLAELFPLARSGRLSLNGVPIPHNVALSPGVVYDFQTREIQLTVSSFCLPDFVVQCRQYTSVGKVAALVRDHIRFSDFVLMYNGVVLDAERPLAYYKIGDNAQVFTAVRRDEVSEPSVEWHSRESKIYALVFKTPDGRLLGWPADMLEKRRLRDVITEMAPYLPSAPIRFRIGAQEIVNDTPLVDLPAIQQFEGELVIHMFVCGPPE